MISEKPSDVIILQLHANKVIADDTIWVPLLFYFFYVSTLRCACLTQLRLYAIDIEDGHSCSFNGAKYTNVVTCVNKIVRVSQVESIQSVTRPGSTIVVGNPARAKQVLNANQEKLKSALFDSDDESSEDIIAAATAAERKKRADRKKMLKLQEETAAREKELERLKRENDAKRKKEAAEKKKQEVETAAKRAAVSAFEEIKNHWFASIFWTCAREE
eukprot:m.331010 g.331010  ORF g.331010 m.331010 type:complete len:217 (+) comp20468_c0_seq1:446-1096(+)